MRPKVTKLVTLPFRVARGMAGPAADVAQRARGLAAEALQSRRGSEPTTRPPQPTERPAPVRREDDSARGDSPGRVPASAPFPAHAEPPTDEPAVSGRADAAEPASGAQSPSAPADARPDPPASREPAPVRPPTPAPEPTRDQRTPAEPVPVRPPTLAPEPTPDQRTPAEPLPAEPAHVSEEPVVVAENADPGAEDGPGPDLRVAAPWEGYDEMTVKQVVSRLGGATPEEVALVELYENTHRARKTVITAVARQRKAAAAPGSPGARRG